MVIENRVALITGSASGMGKDTAFAMAQAGARVVINDINQEKVNEAIDELKDQGFEALGIVADVCEKAAVEDMVGEATAVFGGVDILVNNAGMERAGPIRKLSEEDWDITIKVNLKGAFLCTKAAHGQMVERGFGRIINIASRAWLGGPGQTPYSSAKAGVIGLTRSTALELGKYGITSNCIAPGLIHTPMWDELEDKTKNYLLSKQPTGCLGDTGDIANAVSFLASENSSFITGQVLYVCGGRSLYSG